MTLETKTNENWTFLDATYKLKLLRLTLLACMNFKKGSGMVLEAKNFHLSKSSRVIYLV